MVLQILLFKLVDNKSAAGYVASAVADNFDKLPEDVRNELLLRLAEDEDGANYVAEVVPKHFDKLPEDVRNALMARISKLNT
jgi:hypothetical protein